MSESVLELDAKLGGQEEAIDTRFRGALSAVENAPSTLIVHTTHHESAKEITEGMHDPNSNRERIFDFLDSVFPDVINDMGPMPKDRTSLKWKEWYTTLRESLKGKLRQFEVTSTVQLDSFLMKHGYANEKAQEH